MSKRQLFEQLESDFQTDVAEPPVKKHSLDSDEEDDGQERKYNLMGEDDIEGQEDSTIDRDGDIQITPFNMKEELEEGHFDTEGNFYWNKRPKDEIRDSWLENIDWIKVKEVAHKNRDQESDSDEEEEEINEIAMYKEVLSLMAPGETVAKALRRLGGNKANTASEKWKKKKKVEEETKNDGNQELLLKLTGLADEILSKTGNMGIYQDTYEAISFRIKKDEGVTTRPTLISKDINDDDALDMFADNFDEENVKRRKLGQASEGSGDDQQKKDAKPEAEEVKNIDLGEVMWEYKWKKEDTEIHGPYSSTEMQKWTEMGYFDKAVLVRKHGQDGLFYTSKRVDFDLYT